MKRGTKRILTYAVLLLLGVVFIYPFLFLISASFKSNTEILTSMRLLPQQVKFDGFIEGWRGVGQYGFELFFMNTFKLVIPTVLLTVCSCTIVAYGFARFEFKGRKPLFFIMISTLMLPNAVVIIPKYILFNQLGWLDSYLPFIVPAAFACFPFFIFAMMQFLRGVPKELDESAYMDGCGTFKILTHILLPVSKPALFSIGIFQFIWTWNDFFNPLIYINSVRNYPLSLGLRMTIDAQSAVSWNRVMAMSFLSMIPCVIVFFLAQDYFVEGIATTGIKG